MTAPLKNMQHKVAFITGGASGLGLALARTFGAAGMHIAIADVRQDRLDEAVALLTSAGINARGYMLDVSDRTAYGKVADAVEQQLGPVQLLCNNAGIGVIRSLAEATYQDWDWILGVNLGGVVNGLQTFLPRMRAHGLGAHILSTASAAGLIASENMAIYVGSKMAVVGITEVLRAELANENIGASVLCPHLMRTNIHEHANLRPSAARTGTSMDADAIDKIKAFTSAGMDPMEVARHALQAVRDNKLYVIPFPELRDIITQRFRAILAALPDEVPDPVRVAAEAPTLTFQPYREALGLD